MLTLAASCAVIGTVLALRFKAMVLIPMNTVILATIAALEISRGNAPLVAVFDAVIVIIVGDLGYVCSVTARFLARRHTCLERDR